MKNRTKAIAILLTAVVLVVASCAPNLAAPAPGTPAGMQVGETSVAPTVVNNPEAVLRAITEALNNKDVGAAAAMLADNVTQTLIPAPSGTGVYNGKAALSARFKEVVAVNPVHRLTQCQTINDQVTCQATFSDDSTRPLGFDLEFKVTAIVQAGLLKSVTWAMTDQSLAKMQAAMAPQPTPSFDPPVPASKIDDIVGVWFVNFIEGSGQGQVTFTADGTYSIVGINGSSKGVTVDSGKFQFDGALGQLTWGNPTATCLNPQGSKAVPCVAAYQLYVIKQDGKIVRLKFVSVDDQVWDRRATFSGKIVSRVQP